MRRIAILLLSILIVFSVTACTAQNIQAKDVDFAFHCKANINCNSEQISCDLSHTAPGMASIQLLSGDLNGLNYYWSGDDFTVSYSGLSAKSDDCVLPQTSFAVILLQTLDYAQKSGALTKTHGNEFSGNLNGIDFTITADSGTGHIQTISIPHSRITAELYDYTEQGL